MDHLPAREFALREHWPLLLILSIAACLRLWQINESLWLDELHSAWVVAGSVGEIAERAQIGNQSPLYFYLPWVSTAVFGTSEWALRLPSLIAGVGLIAFAYAIVYQCTRSRMVAITCAILAALDHNFLFYATETRPYACLQLAAAGQLLLFWKLQQSTTARLRIGFVAVSVLMFYLHYTALLLLTGEFVFAVARAAYLHYRGQPSMYSLRRLSVDLICIAAFTVPTLAHVLDIGSRRGDWASFIKGTSLVSAVSWFSLVSYVAVPALACFVVWNFKKAATLRSKGFAKADMLSNSDAACVNESQLKLATAALLVCWLGVPLVLVWLLTVTDIARLFLPRYIIGAALAPILFAGLCVGVWKSVRSQALIAAGVLAFAILTSNSIDQLRYDGRLIGDRSENWRDAVAYVNRDNQPDEAIFVRSGLLEADQLTSESSVSLRDYCLSPVTSIYSLTRPRRDLFPLPTSSTGKLTNEEVERLHQSQGAWFIVNGSSATVVNCRDRVLASLTRENLTAVVTDQLQFGNVGIFRVATDPS